MFWWEAPDVLGVPPSTVSNPWVLFWHFLKYPLTLRPQELTRVDLRICRFRGDLSVEVGHALKVSEGYFCLNVAPDLFLKGETHSFHCKQGEIFFWGFFFGFCFNVLFFSLFVFSTCICCWGVMKGGVRNWKSREIWVVTIFHRICVEPGGDDCRAAGSRLVWGRIPGQALAFGMANCGPRRTDPRSNLFSICFRKGRDWFHLICGWTMESC